MPTGRVPSRGRREYVKRVVDQSAFRLRTQSRNICNRRFKLSDSDGLKRIGHALWTAAKPSEGAKVHQSIKCDVISAPKYL